MTLQQPFSEIKNIWAEIRRLRGRLDRINSGGIVITGTGGGSNPTIPTALQGALIRGNSTPGWERLVAPTPAADEQYELRYDDGDTEPSWKLTAGAGDDVFTINMATAL